MNKVELSQKRRSSPEAYPMVAVLTNPLSSTNKKSLPKIRKVISSAHNVIHFEINNIDDIDEALALFARSQPSMLIINGGDGTVGRVLQALLYRNPFRIIPPLAILPGGKTNMTCADLGMVGTPVAVLKKMLDVVNKKDSSASIVTRNIIEMDIGDGKEKHVGTFFGAAGIVKSVLWCRENIYPKKIPDFIAHFITFGVLIGASANLFLTDKTAEPDQMKIYIQNGGRLSDDFAAVSCTTLDDLIFGVKPYPNFGSGGLKFGCVQRGGSNMFRAVFGLITGSFGRGNVKGVQVRRSDMIRIQTSGSIMLDGEIFTTQPNVPVILKGDKTLSFVSLNK